MICASAFAEIESRTAAVGGFAEPRRRYTAKSSTSARLERASIIEESECMMSSVTGSCEGAHDEPGEELRSS